MRPGAGTLFWLRYRHACDRRRLVHGAQSSLETGLAQYKTGERPG